MDISTTKAKYKLRWLVDRALQGEVTGLTRYGVRKAVVVSADAWDALQSDPEDPRAIIVREINREAAP